MQKIVKENQPFQRIDTDYKQAKEIIKMMGEDFKIELLDEFKEQGETVFSFYINTIPQAAAERLLKDCKPDYVKKYSKLTQYFSSLNPSIFPSFNTKSDFVTFADMCE
jgi:threonyl-tRNA synthetase